VRFRVVGGHRHQRDDPPPAAALLRPRHHRPRDRRAAEQRDEIASFQARAAGREGLLITSRL
jgi:hypothetical protein